MGEPQFFKKSATLLWVLLALGTLALVGYLDYITGPEIASSFFYLIPVAVAVWHTGKAFGIAISALSALVWLAADIMSGTQYSHMATTCWNGAIRLGFFLVVTILLFSLKRALENEQTLLRHDTVTTALNSRYFDEVLKDEIDRSKRYAHHFTLIYIGLDNFKKVNAVFGHKQGDSALWYCVATMAGILRRSDIIGRLGGDEFCCLLPETGFDAAAVAISRLLSALEKEMTMHKWPITFSVGALTFVKPPAQADDTIKLVDKLMCDVKRNGKNGVQHQLFGS